MRIKARSKVNLFLDVLGKRSDGYHEIATVFAPLDLHDEVVVKKAKRGISVKCDNPEIPTGEKSNVRKAALKMYEAAGKSPDEEGLEIEVKNRIPVAGGLGGSATNAAAVITALNKIWKLSMGRKKLVQVASSIGADVPFFLFNKPAVATGIGNKLKFVNVPGMHVVVISPSAEYFPGMHKTKVLYERMDAVHRKPLNFKEMLAALKKRDALKIASRFENAFEAVAFEHAPALGRLKIELLKHGALAAGLAGAGPSIFAIARSRKHAEEIASKMKSLPGVKQAVATRTLASK